MFKFRVLAGQHIDENGAVRKTGEVFQTRQDLDAMFNSPGSRKFERVVDDQSNWRFDPQTGQPIGGVSDGLDGMTVRQLQELALAEEIDLGGVTKKEEIVGTIRRARA